MANSIIALKTPTAPEAPRAFTLPSMLRGGSPKNVAICVLGDALLNLTEHFRDGGMPARQASELAHKALHIDAAQWRADWTAMRRDDRAQRRDHARFMLKAKAVAAAWA